MDTRSKCGEEMETYYLNGIISVLFIIDYNSLFWF
jgi:hypothetical protein